MSEGSGPSPAELGITQKDIGVDKSVNNPTPTIGSRNQRLKIREFTKSTPEGKQVRDDAARDIMDQRTEAQDSRQRRNDSLVADRVANEQNLENAQTAKVEAEDQLLALRGELTDRSTSWLAKARAFFSESYRGRTQKLQKQLPKSEDRVTRESGYLKIREQLYQENLVQLERQFTELSQWNKTHLPAGRETLQKFYAKQGKLLKEYDEGVEMQRQRADLEAYRQEHGTIAEVTDKYQGYIVHGITPSFGGTNNQMLGGHADWIDKLMVIMVEKPPLSGSFVKKGNGPQQLWSPIGVVFKDGIVAEGHGGDALSRAVDKKTKTTSLSPGNIASYQEGLVRAVARNNTSGTVDGTQYNEVIMEFGATPGAIYLNLDQVGNTAYDNNGMIQRTLPFYRDAEGNIRKHPPKRIEYQDIFETARFVGLPVVAMKNGTLYESTYAQTQGLTLGRELSPQDITSLQSEVPAANRPQILQRANSVLKTLAIA